MIFPVWRQRHDPKDLYGGLSRMALTTEEQLKTRSNCTGTVEHAIENLH